MSAEIPSVARLEKVVDLNLIKPKKPFNFEWLLIL